MSKYLTEFRKKFRLEELKIFETNYWFWSLRPHQATLGAGILSLKRECPSFSELSQEEFNDLSNIIKLIEGNLKSLYSYDIINYLMLMMVDKQVHFHVVPRYEREIELLGRRWSDDAWPGIPNLAGEALDNETLLSITNQIKNNL